MSATINTVSDITLVTLQGCPSDSSYLSSVFDKMAEHGINIDMISVAPAHGAYTSLSVTISDNDLGEMLKLTNQMKTSSETKPIVSSGNYKISVSDTKMKNTPGIAATVFKAVQKASTDIRIVTTSETEISLLVTEADYDSTLEILKDTLNK